LTLGCGLVFEMPVLSFLLSKIGIINHRVLRRAWKYAVIAIFIIAAIVTPTPDIFNMTILALPMLFLYELSIWVSKFSGKKR
ncbi:MAG: twin-arginine translocase subunit TatC, partial [Candidatus Omnitrophica bacterium]|nr:twin-arginine translocase subunit TatC [Candidatus Omnitrophota bacterium]